MTRSWGIGWDLLISLGFGPSSTPRFRARARWRCFTFHANSHRALKHGGLTANPTTTDEWWKVAAKVAALFSFPFSCCCDLSLLLSLARSRSFGSGAEVGRRIGGHSWICSALARACVRRTARTPLSAFPLVLRGTWKRSLLFFLPPCWFLLYFSIVVELYFTPSGVSRAVLRQKKSLYSGTSSISFLFECPSCIFYFLVLQ